MLRNVGVRSFEGGGDRDGDDRMVEIGIVVEIGMVMIGWWR